MHIRLTVLSTLRTITISVIYDQVEGTQSIRIQMTILRQGPVNKTFFNFKEEFKIFAIK